MIFDCSFSNAEYEDYVFVETPNKGMLFCACKVAECFSIILIILLLHGLYYITSAPRDISWLTESNARYPSQTVGVNQPSL